MARGKFNKRGGGKRFDAQSAEEIELRNQRLAEFEAEREKRRAEEEEDGDEEGGDGGGEEKEEEAKPEAKPTSDKKEDKPVRVTSAEDHKKNLARLEAVKKRREEAERRRKEEEEMAQALEKESRAKAEALLDDGEDDKKKKKKSKEKAIPKLSKIEIKKMKPALLKEALKERGLDIQGNAKTLTERLLKYESER